MAVVGDKKSTDKGASSYAAPACLPAGSESGKGWSFLRVLRLMFKAIGVLSLSLFLLCYIAVALLNYSAVQSTLGSIASSKLSEQWGGKVRIGSLRVNVFNHLSLRDVEIIAPGNDTIVVAGHVGCQFNRFPLRRDKDNRFKVKMRLEVNYVNVDNTYYHLHTYDGGTNIQEFASIFASGEKKEPAGNSFVVDVGRLNMRNVRYHQDLDRTPKSSAGDTLTGKPRRVYAQGVNIQHMDLRNIDGLIRNIRVERDHVTCRIEALSAEEVSGFNLRRLQTNVYVARNGIAATNMALETDSTRLRLDALLRYRDWKTMSYYCDSVYMLADIADGSYAEMSDVAYWAPALWGIGEHVDIKGRFHGPVADLHAENVAVAFGRGSELQFDGYINGLPYIDNTVIGVTVDRLSTNYRDLAEVRHPEGVKMKAPEIIRQLGDINIGASFVGTIRDFYVTLQMDSRLGPLDADLVLQLGSAAGPSEKKIRYLGEISSTGLSLPSEMKNNWVSRAGFNLSLQGDGFNPANMTASLEGQLSNVVFRGNAIDAGAIDATAADGKINIKLNVDDPLADIDLDAKADIASAIRSGTVSADVHHLDLARLKLVNIKGVGEHAPVCELSSRMAARFEYEDAANMRGRLTIGTTQLVLNGSPISLDKTTLTLAEENGQKDISLMSDVASADVNGYFDYKSLPLIARHICDKYMPLYYNARKNGAASAVTADSSELDLLSISDAELDMTVRWTDRYGRIAALLPDMVLAPGTSIHANYTFTEGPRLVVRSDSVGWGSMVMHDVGLEGADRGGRYGLLLDAGDFYVGSTRIFPSPHLGLLLGDTLSDLRLNWAQTAKTGGKLALTMRSSSECNLIDFERAPDFPVEKDLGNWFVIDGQRWNVVSDGSIYLSRDRLMAQKLRAEAEFADDKHPSFTIAAAMDGDPHDDSVSVVFDSIDIGRFAFIWEKTGFDIDGILVGGASLRGQLMGRGEDAAPVYLGADIRAENCVVDGTEMGTLRLHSSWDAEQKHLNLNLTDDRHIRVDGYYNMEPDAISPLNFNVEADGFNLKAVAPLLSSFSSRLEGGLSGNIVISGTPKGLKLAGDAILDSCHVAIDFVGTTYSCSDTIHFENGGLVLRDLKLRDSRGDTAFLRGGIVNLLTDSMFVDIGVRSRRFLFMNTDSRNGAFYGTVLASANGRVYGKLDDLDIEIDARTGNGSRFAIPVSDRRQVREFDYIEFATPAQNIQSSVATLQPQKKKSSNWRLALNLTVTPDLRLTLPMDFSQMKATAAATGEGDLRVSLASDKELSILGGYQFSAGTLNIDLLSLVSRNFTIEEGSSLNFMGPLTDARFDLGAVYSQRVNLSTLTGGASATESGTKTIQVQNVIALSGSLQEPDIRFDIRLPGADQSVEEEVFAYIDRSNERDMLNQTVSLLVMSQFYNSSASSANTAANTTDNQFSGGYAVVANSVGSVVSNMVQFVNVNFDYKAETELTTRQFDVDINKEWDKFYFETTFGFGGDTREMAEVDNTNQIVGDVLLGYKINRRLHLFVFNRSNTNDYTRYDLPYKQGLGLKYTRDFDSWHDLFIKK